MPLSDLLGMLEQYRGASATAPPATVEQDFSKVAEAAPQSHLAGGLSEAFRSSETPPFAQMISSLFSNSNGTQRAGILNQLLGAVGPDMLASGAFGGLAGFLRSGNSVTPEQANQIQPRRCSNWRSTPRSRTPPSWTKPVSSMPNIRRW